MKNKNPICCLCGKECETKYGNNPAPLNGKPYELITTSLDEIDMNDRCCNVCDDTKVIPARIKGKMSIPLSDIINKKAT